MLNLTTKRIILTRDIHDLDNDITLPDPDMDNDDDEMTAPDE